MLHIVKALLALRLAAMVATFIVVLSLLGIWMLTHGQLTDGIVCVAGVLLSAAVLGLAVVRHTAARSP